LERLNQVHRTVLSEAQEAVSAGDLWCGLSVQAVDGTALTAPDTSENQAAYPQQKVQRPGCGFPILRLVRGRLRVRGFRTTQIALVTTLLDTQHYPLEAFGLLYLRRWWMELAFRDLKITLQMDQLSCKTPDNLARGVMLEAARLRSGPPSSRSSRTASRQTPTQTLSAPDVPPTPLR
jgi:hypothetical protein